MIVNTIKHKFNKNVQITSALIKIKTKLRKHAFIVPDKLLIFKFAMF